MRETPHPMRASTPVCTQVKEGKAPTLTPQALGESINIERRKGINAMCDWKVPPSGNQYKYKRGTTTVALHTLSLNNEQGVIDA